MHLRSSLNSLKDREHSADEFILVRLAGVGRLITVSAEFLVRLSSLYHALGSTHVSSVVFTGVSAECDQSFPGARGHAFPAGDFESHYFLRRHG
jgi:hypothetical protein